MYRKVLYRCSSTYSLFCPNFFIVSWNDYDLTEFYIFYSTWIELNYCWNQSPLTSETSLVFGCLHSCSIMPDYFFALNQRGKLARQPAHCANTVWLARMILTSELLMCSLILVRNYICQEHLPAAMNGMHVEAVIDVYLAVNGWKCRISV